MNLIEEIAGELCKILLPIEERIFFGNSKSSIALCTLSSISLLREIANSSVMDKIAVAGRLLSENKGIDSLVRYVISNTKISTIILCGEDATGHRPGHSLLCCTKMALVKMEKLLAHKVQNQLCLLQRKKCQDFKNRWKLLIKSEILGFRI